MKIWVVTDTMVAIGAKHCFADEAKALEFAEVYVKSCATPEQEAELMVYVNRGYGRHVVHAKFDGNPVGRCEVQELFVG